MDDKIKKLASNLSEILPEPTEPQNVWDSLRVLMNEQKAYFEKIPPENIIKVIFYIWSLKETGNFKLGEKMLNQISFALIFGHEGNYHRESCGDCEGEGDVDCYECNAGKISCEQCDGDGIETCSECGGSGEIEDEGETLTCSECGGEGEVDCDNCGGDGEVDCPSCNYGRLTCDNCGGDGEVDTDEFEYYKNYIVTWDSFIKNRCEITEEHTDITMSEYEFDKRRAEYISLSVFEAHNEFRDWVLENEMYCAYYGDNPSLLYTNSMEIFIPNVSLKYTNV